MLMGHPREQVLSANKMRPRDATDAAANAAPTLRVTTTYSDLDAVSVSAAAPILPTAGATCASFKYVDYGMPLSPEVLVCLQNLGLLDTRRSRI